MRLVIVYAFERIKIQQGHPADCAFFEEVDQIVVERMKQFYLKVAEGRIHDWVALGYIKEHEQEQRLQECMDQFRRYFWNFYQFGFLPNHAGFFEEFSYSTGNILHNFNDIYEELKRRFSQAELNQHAEFGKRYNIYTLIFENTFSEIFFKYHEIDQALKNKPESLNFLNEFSCLIQLLPYYSPYFVQTITELESYNNSTQEKKHFSARYSPLIVKGQTYAITENKIYATTFLDLNHRPIALVDSILQFIFQHTQHLIRWHQFQDELHQEMTEAERSQKIQLSEQEECEQLDQIAKILEAMFFTLPKEQKKIFDSAKNFEKTQSKMLSLMFFNFKSNYLKKLNEVKSDESPKKGLSSREANKLYRAFFEYLESEFTQRSIQTESSLKGRIDTWWLALGKDNKTIFKGSCFRANFNNHKEKIN